MTPAARLSAAIELIDTIDAQRVPAAKALKEWGTAHRYAGSGDRAAISGLLWDVLRRRASSAWLMDADTPRARALGMLKLERGMDADAIAALCDGARFAPEPLSEVERSALTSGSLKDAPAHVAGDYPEWLDSHLAQVFGDDRVAEATAMASRAPLDLRVNTLKANREKVLPSLAHLARSRRRGRRSVCASNSAPTRAIPAFIRKRISSRALLKCRTRARSWRPCCRRPNPASR
jgi:16S rRNA (cytosine967-C5)-methyltransferase